MTRKHWMLVALVLLLSGISLYLNKDWFAKDSIQIIHRSSPPRAWSRARGEDSAVNPVLFEIVNRKLKLTSVKVVPISEIETNKYPHPIWCLVAKSNSAPVKDFFYGAPIRGMQPSVEGATPDPLEPGVPYRLLIEAGTQKADHDFVPVARTR